MKSREKLGLSSGIGLVIFFSFLCISPGYAALVTETSNGESAVFDGVSNNYWIPNLGYFQWAFSNTTNQISQLNNSSYFGINNWHLASPIEMDTLLTTANFSDIPSAFTASFSTSGSYHIPGNQICFPIIGCFGDPGHDVAYTETHWYGIYDETTTFSEQVLIPPPSGFCGGPFFPPCEYETVYFPAHYAVDFVFRDYAPNSDFLNDSFFPNYDVSTDNGFASAGSNYLYGAWVIGTNNSSVVPEPATMLLLGSGLIGLAGYGRKRFFKK